MTQEKILEVLQLLEQILNDQSVPKNVRLKISNAIQALNLKEQASEVKISKSLQELDELDDNPNIPAYTRTQIWNAVSFLESI